MTSLNYSFREGLGKIDYSLLQNIGTRSSCNEIRTTNGDPVEGRAAPWAARQGSFLQEAICHGAGLWRELDAFLQLRMFRVGDGANPIPCARLGASRGTRAFVTLSQPRSSMCQGCHRFVLSLGSPGWAQQSQEFALT